MKYLLFSILVFSSVAFSQSKSEIDHYLVKLKGSGMLSEQQVELARKELANMNDQNLKKLVKKGMQAKSDPEILKKVNQLKN